MFIMINSWVYWNVIRDLDAFWSVCMCAYAYVCAARIGILLWFNTWELRACCWNVCAKKTPVTTWHNVIDATNHIQRCGFVEQKQHTYAMVMFSVAVILYFHSHDISPSIKGFIFFAETHIKNPIAIQFETNSKHKNSKISNVRRIHLRIPYTHIHLIN